MKRRLVYVIGAVGLAAILVAFATRYIAAKTTDSPAPSPYGTIVWQAGDPTLGKQGPATSGQCGTPVQNGSSITFNLRQNGTQCIRNQNLPLDSSGSTFRLADGKIYTWVFDYIDGNAAGQPPGVGDDGGNAQSIIWQIHGMNEPATPLTQLGFGNTPPNSSAGQPPQWVMSGCGASLSAPFWTGSYTPQERDRFTIRVLVSATSSGWIKLYRNGVPAASCNGPTYHNSTGDPWWNYGPYKWRWGLANAGGSQMTEVQATFPTMTLYER